MSAVEPTPSVLARIDPILLATSDPLGRAHIIIPGRASCWLEQILCGQSAFLDLPIPLEDYERVGTHNQRADSTG